MPADPLGAGRPGSIRWRTTWIAVVVVGAALLVTGTALILTLRHTLTEQVREDATLRAQEVALALSTGTQPNLAVGDAEDVVVQVLRSDGTVAMASPNIADEPTLADLDDGESDVIQTPVAEGDFLAVAVDADGDASGQTVIAARPLDGVDETTRTVAVWLLVGVPVLLLVVAATMWRLVGPVLERAERSDRRQRLLVSDASHELRSPIAAIRQQAEVALAHPHRQTLSGLASPVLAAAIRLQELVEDILVLARLDERALRLERQPVDLDDLVLDEIRRLRSSTLVRVDGSGVGAGRVSGDPRMLARVLRNAGDNAARHARLALALSVSIDRTGWVEVLIDDDGPGIAPADRVRVFERFVRLDEAPGRDRIGSGLGLAIVAEVVAAHGGTVSFEESPLGGARLLLRLPSADDAGGDAPTFSG